MGRSTVASPPFLFVGPFALLLFGAVLVLFVHGVIMRLIPAAVRPALFELPQTLRAPINNQGIVVIYFSLASGNADVIAIGAIDAQHHQ